MKFALAAFQVLDGDVWPVTTQTGRSAGQCHPGGEAPGGQGLSPPGRSGLRGPSGREGVTPRCSTSLLSCVSGRRPRTASRAPAGERGAANGDVDKTFGNTPRWLVRTRAWPCIRRMTFLLLHAALRTSENNAFF